MKNIKFMIIILFFAVLLGCGVRTKAENTIAPDIKLDKDGDVHLFIPKDADKVFTNESDKVKYEVKKGATLSAETNQAETFTVPVVVESEITNDDEEVTEGTTTYTSELNKAEQDTSQSIDNFSFTSTLPNIFGKKVSAASQNRVMWDRTAAVRFHVTITWVVSGGNVRLTRVTGGYTNYDNRTLVTRSSVMTANNGPRGAATGGFIQQINTTNLGSSRSWAVNRNYSYVKILSSSTQIRATYSATLRRGNSTWSFSTINSAY
ncbi:hypothetical protein [Lactococcus petauri]|uniref:hypothetical protein n=1 Tax=Lactococcus petauri TaxID=1940789 RepID=UPI0022E708B6|nr:hypothetical protein [Lactococcus petauri]